MSNMMSKTIIARNSEKSNCYGGKVKVYAPKYFCYHKSAKITVSVLMNKWLDSVERNIKISTFEKYKCIVCKHIVPTLGDLHIKNLSAVDIQTFIDGLLEKGLERSTINNIIVVLNMGLLFAEKEYDVLCPRAEFLKIQKKEMKVLSVDEQNKFVKYLIERNDIFSFGMLLALFTGMRIGELCALKWEDISCQTIKINKTMQRIKNGVL